MHIPTWIDSDYFTDDLFNSHGDDFDDQASTLASIIQGGCASGAYMPAVTYYNARETMCEHGDDVLDYIQDALGELPAPPQDVSWSGMACHYLSLAVELWAGDVWSLSLIHI